MALTVAGLLAACGGGGGSAAPTTTTVPTTTASEWTRIVPGGDCHCADGSEFAFWERPADRTKVVFFLDGGGACTDATTCAFLPEDPAYDWNVRGDDPAQDGGIFDFVRADNPFRDYSFVLVPSCTGDMHLGGATREYSPELTVEYNGFVNGTAALSYLAEHYPDAAQLVVVGKTAGSVAAPVYGGLVADLLPAAQVTVLGGQSGHLPNDPDLNAGILGKLWGAYDNMPGWEVNEGLTARDWGPPRFWIQAGLHNPEIVLARFDFAYDREAAQGAKSIGRDPSKLLAVIDANEAAIEAAGVVLQSFTAPGDDHGSSNTTSSTSWRSTASGWSVASRRWSPVNHSTTSTATSANRLDGRERSAMKQEVVLALLAKEPSYGYELRARLRLALGPLGEAMNDGQIYVTLTRLEKAGLVVSERAAGAVDRPDRKVYLLTPDGQERVAEWLAEVSWPKPDLAEFHLKLVAAAAAGLADPLSIVDAQRRELLRRLRDAQRAAMAEPDGSDAALLLEGIVLRLQADLRWLEACEQSWTIRRSGS